MRILGLMTGTSVDSADFAVVDFTHEGDTLHARIADSGEKPWPRELRSRVLDAVTRAEVPSLASLTLLDAEVGEFLAGVVGDVRDRISIGTDTPIDLVVSPGQTLFHNVEKGRTLATLAIGDPSRIHTATDIPTLGTVRNADIARGGTGAPLAPLLDRLLLGPEGGCAVNIGGIANATMCFPATVGTAGIPKLRAGDTGPGNGLIDAVAAERTGTACDTDGALAKAGNVHEQLLQALLADPYFALPFPKSTGREYFSPTWLAARAREAHVDLAALSTEDVLATLTELTARALADALTREAQAEPQMRLHITGGGAHNPTLMTRIAKLLPACTVETGPLGGLDPDIKEAFLMALIGYFSAHGLPGALTDATGAYSPAVLGQLTPPSALRDVPLLKEAPRQLLVEDSRE